MAAARRIPLGEQLAAVQAERVRAEARVTALEQELETFREKVWQVALDAKKTESWCQDGFNNAMDELDLPRLPHSFEATVTVTAQQRVTVTVYTEDLEDPTEEVVREILLNLDNADDNFYSELDNGGWTYDKVVIDSITAHTD